MDYNVGDEVEVTIKGQIAYVAEDDGTFSIRDVTGWHTSFAPDADGCTVVKTGDAEPEFKNGVYMDEDGEVFLRQDASWYAFDAEINRHVSPATAKRLKLATLPYDEQPW